MKLVLLPAITGIVLASPALAQDRSASPLKTVRSATRSATIVRGGNSFTAIPTNRNDPPQTMDRRISSAQSDAAMVF